jgi:hypothetical protein
VTAPAADSGAGVQVLVRTGRMRGRDASRSDAPPLRAGIQHLS